MQKEGIKANKDILKHILGKELHGENKITQGFTSAKVIRAPLWILLLGFLIGYKLSQGFTFQWTSTSFSLKFNTKEDKSSKDQEENKVDD